MPIDLLSNLRYYIDDQKRGAFELGAPTTDVLDVTGRPALRLHSDFSAT
jgi:NAD(P)H dehydrogenase (quinone)